MRGKKFEFVLVMVAIMVLLWFVVIRSYTGVDEKNEQAELVNQADVLAEKELYVRAIPLYQQAIKIDAGEENHQAVEQKLLDAFKKFKDVEGYRDLVDARIKEGYVTVEEYLQVTNDYLNNNDISDALHYILDGLRSFPDNQNLKELYETYRYSYRTYNTSLENVINVLDTERIPSYTGKAWIYSGMTGNRIFEDEYEQATPYYTDETGSSYAVVRINSEYIVIDGEGHWYGRDNGRMENVLGISEGRVIAKKDGLYGFYDYDFNLLSENHQYDQITYFSCGAAAVKKGDKWGIISDSGETILDINLDDVALNSLGQAYAANMAIVKKNGKWLLVDTEGKTIVQVNAAEVKAPESGGYFAVANDQGEWGFMNSAGELVIEYQYIDACSFSDHVAAVKKYSEWNYISEENKVVIDENFVNANPFHNGVAAVMPYDSISYLNFEYLEEGNGKE